MQRVEHERALARAAQPGDDDEPTEGDVEVEAGEIVLADTAQADALGRGKIDGTFLTTDNTDGRGWDKRQRGFRHGGRGGHGGRREGKLRKPGTEKRMKDEKRRAEGFKHVAAVEGRERAERPEILDF